MNSLTITRFECFWMVLNYFWPPASNKMITMFIKGMIFGFLYFFFKKQKGPSVGGLPTLTPHVIIIWIIRWWLDGNEVNKQNHGLNQTGYLNFEPRPHVGTVPTIKETFLCNRKWSTETNIKSRLSSRQKFHFRSVFMVQGHTLACCQDEITLDLGQWWVINQNIVILERFVTLENSIIALLDWVNAIIKNYRLLTP